MSAFVQVKGVEGVRAMLQPWLERELSKQLDKATKAGAKVMAADLKVALRPVSKRMARAVRTRRARRERPAWVVGSSRKVAFFWPFVIGGTKDHGPKRSDFLVWEDKGRTIRAKRVRGVKPNPVVSRVARSSQEKAYRAMEKELPA